MKKSAVTINQSEIPKKDGTQMMRMQATRINTDKKILKKINVNLRSEIGVIRVQKKLGRR